MRIRNLLTDEVIINFLKSQTAILKQFFEDAHFPVSPGLDLLESLKDQKVLNEVRKQITKPQKPFNKNKQEYLLLALYKSNPSLLQTHEQRLPNVKDYKEELAIAEKEFKEKALKVHHRRKALLQNVVEKGTGQEDFFKRRRENARKEHSELLRKARINKLQAAIALFKFEPKVNCFDENGELDVEKFRLALSPAKAENKQYLEVPRTWSEWWYGTQGGDKALLESMRNFYFECDILLKSVSTQSTEILKRLKEHTDLGQEQQDELQKNLSLLENQYLGIQRLKNDLKDSIKGKIEDKKRFEKLDTHWGAEFEKTSVECTKILQEDRKKLDERKPGDAKVGPGFLK